MKERKGDVIGVTGDGRVREEGEGASPLKNQGKGNLIVSSHSLTSCLLFSCTGL